jgi:2-polyprenyl-6-methoxyphenol hydroxylase-like FAD-dependent oxidoreductase
MSDPSCIEVIIVGCGFAGLACAIESRLKGHEVTLLEKHQKLDTLGMSSHHAEIESLEKLTSYAAGDVRN